MERTASVTYDNCENYSEELAPPRPQIDQKRMSSYEDVHHEEPAAAPRHTRPKSMHVGPIDDDTGIVRIERGGGGGSAPEREQRPPRPRSPERPNPMIPRQQVLLPPFFASGTATFSLLPK